MEDFSTQAAVEAVARNSYGRLVAYLRRARATSRARKTHLATRLAPRCSIGPWTARRKSRKRGCSTPRAIA